MMTGRLVLMCSAPLHHAGCVDGFFGLAPVDVVGADVQCQQRHFAAAAMFA